MSQGVVTDVKVNPTDSGYLGPREGVTAPCERTAPRGSLALIGVTHHTASVEPSTRFSPRREFGW